MNGSQRHDPTKDHYVYTATNNSLNYYFHIVHFLSFFKLNLLLLYSFLGIAMKGAYDGDTNDLNPHKMAVCDAIIEIFKRHGAVALKTPLLEHKVWKIPPIKLH